MTPAVFLLSPGLGGAGVARTIAVKRDPPPVPHPPPPLLERTSEPLVRVSSALPERFEEPAIAMDEVVIRAQRKVHKPPSVRAPESVDFQPCSEWRDLGPKALADSLDTDQHRVRALCPQR